MAEPDQIEFQERVRASSVRPDGRSLPVRIGIVAGSALLVVVGAAAAMGASPAPAATGGPADLAGPPAANGGPAGGFPMADRFRGGDFGFGGGFRDITISAKSGTSLTLTTDDGWTRTIAIGSSTTITKGGQTIAVGDLAVGDQIRFSQTKASDGTFTINAIRVVLPIAGGKVTAVTGTTITVAGRGDTTATIHVDGDTTYEVDGVAGKALADITVGSIVIAEGTTRSDGSLDAATVHAGGLRDGLHDGRGGGPGFRDHDGKPGAEPAPTPATAS